jgi:hypothetical protein
MFGVKRVVKQIYRNWPTHNFFHVDSDTVAGINKVGHEKCLVMRMLESKMPSSPVFMVYKSVSNQSL